ncbi:reverse transcriptase domain-containing protein [Peribacillus butanolivorans]|uniref:reverse transcriptase domain-containing protein n=1 Tax=Peribacillus butanolivorans TaxID=421767 RepID=UPI003BF47344
MRKLGIPTVTDRVIQQAVVQVLTPIFEQKFSPYSYGFRPNKSAHQAIEQARQYIDEGYHYVVDMDLEKFFDKAQHDKLMSLIATTIEDKEWKKSRTKYRNLKKQGISSNEAWRCANSRKGYWRNSNNPVLNTALSNQYWKVQGIKSLIHVIS